MINLSQFKDIMASKSGGKPLSKLQNFYSLCFEAMLSVKTEVDLPSSRRTVQITNPIYSDVDSYVVPADMGLSSIINLSPIKPDNSFYDYDNFSQRQFEIENKFDTSSFSKRYAIKYKDGKSYIMISGTGSNPLIINNCESLTANGNWAVTGGASSLALDTQQFYASNASLSFKVNVGGNQGIQALDMVPVDISSKSAILWAIYLPTVTGVTGLKISLGQNTTNYYTGTVSGDMFGNALHTGWNILQLKKSQFSVGAGTPTWTNVVFAKPEIVGTFTVATDGFRFDNLVANTGVIVEIDYYSSWGFMDVSGNIKEMPTTDSDFILADSDELELFIGEFIDMMTTDIKQAGAGIDKGKYANIQFSRRGIAKDKYNDFRIKYPSERQLMITKYSSRPRFDLPDRQRGW